MNNHPKKLEVSSQLKFNLKAYGIVSKMIRIYSDFWLSKVLMFGFWLTEADILVIFDSGLTFLTSRCASGPRQQSELLRGDRRRHGCGHWLLGQFPPDLELNKPCPCCTQSLPTNFHLPETPPYISQLICWAGTCGVHTVSAKTFFKSSPVLLSARDLPTCENVPTLSTFLRFFTQLLHKNKNLSV